MGWFSKIFSTGTVAVVDSIAGIADRFIQTADEKAKFKKEVAELIQKRDSEIEQTIRTEIGAKQAVLVAELQQGDNYTKRARPTVVYAGLIFICINYVLLPLILKVSTAFGADVGCLITPIDLPGAFWAAWGGICGTWTIGRSFEKRGVQNRAVSAITGTTKPKSLLDM